MSLAEQVVPSAVHQRVLGGGVLKGMHTIEKERKLMLKMKGRREERRGKGVRGHPLAEAEASAAGPHHPNSGANLPK